MLAFLLFLEPIINIQQSNSYQNDYHFITILEILYCFLVGLLWFQNRF